MRGRAAGRTCADGSAARIPTVLRHSFCTFDIFAAIDTIAAETTRRGTTRLLVDLRGVEEEFRFTDHFTIGERVSVRLDHLHRVASLVHPARRTGTSEQVASQRGMMLRVFVAEDAAVAWLCEP